MKSYLKSSVSVGLILLVLYTQVVLPIFQHTGENSPSALSIGNIYQVYEEEALLQPNFIVSDIVDVFSIRGEVGNSLFYTLSYFSLSAFHNLILGILWDLSTRVDIAFTLADKIYPFACFW